jgi:hypothetical protein
MSEETRNYDVLECPWCGHKDRDAWEIDADSGVTNCPGCDKEIEYCRDVSISYTGRKPKDKK